MAVESLSKLSRVSHRRNDERESFAFRKMNRADLHRRRDFPSWPTRRSMASRGRRGNFGLFQSSQEGGDRFRQRAVSVRGLCSQLGREECRSLTRGSDPQPLRNRGEPFPQLGFRSVETDQGESMPRLMPQQLFVVMDPETKSFFERKLITLGQRASDSHRMSIDTDQDHIVQHVEPAIQGEQSARILEPQRGTSAYSRSMSRCSLRWRGCQ